VSVVLLGVEVSCIMGVSELRCKYCKTIKPISEYNRTFFGKYGYDVYCHDCRIEIDKKYASIVEKPCRRCGRIRPISEFGKTASTRELYNKECLDCQEENQQRRRERKFKKNWDGKTRACRRCGFEKPTYEFVSLKRKKNRFVYCRSCISELVRKKLLGYEQQREEYGWPIKKKCKECHRVLPSDSFHLDRRQKTGLACKCNNCSYEQHSQWVNKVTATQEKITPTKNLSKECQICHVLKPVSSFTININSKDGYGGMCSVCRKKYRQESIGIWTAQRINDTKRIVLTQKQCRICDRVLPLEMFSRTKDRKKGYLDHCKDCYRQREKQIFSRWEQERKKTQFEFSLDVPTEKACKTCGKVLPLSEFWAREASKDGFSHYCKACFNKKEKERNKRLKERGFPEDQIPAEKQCGHCKRILPRIMFYRDATSSTGLDSRCIECRKSYGKQYHARPEVKQRKSAYKRRPEMMEKSRIRASMYHKRPEVKERVRVYKREYTKRDYVSEKRRADERKRYQRPDVKQKKKERDSRPEAKARRRRSTHEWYMRKKAEREKQNKQN
jgi:hypothetical protein